MQEKFPRLVAHLEDIDYDCSINHIQWFTCLFCYSFNFEVLVRLWDVFFLKGDKMLFRISLAIYHLLEKKLLRCKNMMDVKRVLDFLPAVLQDPSQLLQIAEMPRFHVSREQIESFRS